MGASDENLPVILRLLADKQENIRGYNFVNQLSNCVYSGIISGQVKLWDSREKEVQIMGTSLKEIERTSNILFTASTHIFIYEQWNKRNQEIITTTHGFSFSAKNAINEVNFGYVDFNDVAALLARQFIQSDANGNSNLTLGYTLLTKQFEYQLLQAGKHVFSNDAESKNALKEMLVNRGFNQVLFPPLPQQKKITYVVERAVSLMPLALQADSILQWVQNYLATDSLLCKTTDCAVTKIEVTEIWTLLYQLQMQIEKVIIHTNTGTIVLTETQAKNIKVPPISLTGLINQKDFLYTITSVNTQNIERKNAFLYQRALLNLQWQNINSIIE